MRFRSQYGKIALIRRLHSISQISQQENVIRPTLKPFQCSRFVAVRPHFESMHVPTLEIIIINDYHTFTAVITDQVLSSNYQSSRLPSQESGLTGSGLIHDQC